MNTCKTCKWCDQKEVRIYGLHLASCLHPQNVTPIGEHISCRINRDVEFDSITKCGSKGKLWEPIPLTRWQKLKEKIYSYVKVKT